MKGRSYSYGVTHYSAYGIIVLWYCVLPLSVC